MNLDNKMKWEPMDEQEQHVEMDRSLGLLTAMSLVVGCVIGAGVFFKPYAIYQATGGAPGMGILGWVIGGLMSILGALTFAEIAILVPRTGGMVAYLTEAFDERVGFLAGWMQTVIFYPAFLAGYGVKMGSELAYYFGDSFALPIALIAITVLVAANALGSRQAGYLQVVATIAKLIPLFLLIVFGFLRGGGHNGILFPLVGSGVSAVGSFGSVLLAVLFAFEGWTNVGAIAGEMKNPARDMPLAIVGGVSIIMAVYLVINVAYLWVIPADQLMNLESPAAAVAEKIFGSSGSTIVRVGIIVSVFGAANGYLMAGSRVAFFLAEERTLPGSRSLAKLNANSVPANSIILVGFLGALYSLTGEFDRLTDLAVFSCWVFYTLTFASVIRMRRTHADWERSYRVPLYPVVPALAIASGLYVIVSQLFLSGPQALQTSLVSLAIMFAGLPVYYLVKRKEALLAE